MSERRPRWVYDAGEEPDPRFSLANERTFLAWVRTALAVLAGAIALDSLGVPHTSWLRTVLVVTLVLFGGLTTALAYLHWARVERAMRRGQEMPSSSLGLVITVAIVVATLVLAAALVVSPT
jgi:putative membrane protein